MFSKRKGNNINGWIIIDKPAGITSTGVVNKIKRAFSAKKVGHAGTLDPDATGVLPIALGEATKTIPHIMDEIKSYHFCVKFGEATDTDDAAGEIINTSNNRPKDDKISALLPKYTGFIEQTPPNYSAIKVNGVRAYDLARSGKHLKLRARSLFVKELKFLERVDEDHALLQLTCGKGGYVRSIARDLGKDLKCFAHVKWLKRIWSGPFELKNSISLQNFDEIRELSSLKQLLQPIEVGLQNLPFVTCNTKDVGHIANGRSIIVSSTEIEADKTCWVKCDGKALALGTVRDSQFYPSRVLNI